MPDVRVPPERLPRWVDNFVSRHGETSLRVEDGALAGLAADGSTFAAHPPFGRALGEASVSALAELCLPPERWGVLLVRKGGYAVALLEGDRLVASKTGQRHVQGRTKAGGQSQQRFARRRDNQARVAYEAAAGHAVRVLGEGPLLLITGGDRAAVAAVLEDPRLHVDVVDDLPGVAEPRRDVLERALLDARSARMSVTNA